MAQLPQIYDIYKEFYIIFATVCTNHKMLNYKTYVNENTDRWLIMIHGAGGSIEVWYRQVSDFAPHFNLLLVDLAGHGGSADEVFAEGFNFTHAAEQVMEVVHYLNIKKGHFMGLSLGSIVVRTIAKHYPKLVSSMILAGAVTRLSFKVQLMIQLATKFKRFIPYRTIKRVIARFIIPQEKYARSKNLFLNSAKKVPFDSFLSWLKVGDGVNSCITALFNEYITIPTLYLMGEDDKLFLPLVEQTIRNSHNNASLVIVPNAGHVCNVDNKSFFNRVSIDFFKKI